MRLVLLSAVVAAAATMAAAPMPVWAQGTPQTVQLTKVDVVKVATGFRASKIIGSSVVNEAGDAVGKVDDIIIGEDGKTPFVVLSVGGFLGIGDKLVVQPYEQLKGPALDVGDHSDRVVAEPDAAIRVVGYRAGESFHEAHLAEQCVMAFPAPAGVLDAKKVRDSLKGGEGQGRPRASRPRRRSGTPARLRPCPLLRVDRT